jgi:hypothetical protein
MLLRCRKRELISMTAVLEALEDFLAAAASGDRNGILGVKLSRVAGVSEAGVGSGSPQAKSGAQRGNPK